MRAPARVLACLAVAAAVLAFPAAAPGGEPPNRNDPCSSAGRNTCGTLGIGFYQTYRYGVRWFGDYRRAVPGETQTFCIDLRYWYPSRSYDWRPLTGPLRNRDGELVPLEQQRRMAYALWEEGRTNNADQQAAVMLYVHALMGDARPGEVDPKALNPRVVAHYARIARDAARYHGPYRIDVQLAAASAALRLMSATGVAVPGVVFNVNAAGVRSQVRADASGVARVALRAATAATTSLAVETEPVASTLPKIYGPASNPAAANVQRLAAPDSQKASTLIRRPFSRRQLVVTTTATPKVVLVGESVTDRIMVTGALPTYTQKITVNVHGPFASEAAIVCTGTPAWTGTVDARGSSVLTTQAVAFTAPGYYTFQLVLPPDADHAGLTTPCRDPAETFKVEVQPRVSTRVSSETVPLGGSVFDRITVTGLAGQRARLDVALYGPFAASTGMVCTGTPFWSGTLDVALDGEHQTPPVVLTRPGYYTYRVRIAAAGLVRAVETPCGEPAETVLVAPKPAIKTQVSTQEARVGATITDKVVITGLGTLTVPVRVELWGPFASRAAIRCEGTPYWLGSFTAKGDGTYTTQPVRLDRAGYYTYRESIAAAATGGGGAVITACGEVAETTVALAHPQIATTASREVVHRTGGIFDRITVRGLGKTPATLDVALYGPFPTRAAIRCAGTPLWRGNIAVRGDGVVRTPAASLRRAGFYTYTVRLTGGAHVRATSHACGLAAETALGAPLIATGRGEVSAAKQLRPVAAAPTRVRVSSVGIDAPVLAVGIDVARGIVAAPHDIRRTGWWVDGAAPGSRGGAVLVVGHVDRAKVGPGAFYALRRASTAAIVELTAGGRTYRYRVVSVRNYPKTQLPTSIYSRRGRARLVLVTCGGVFNRTLGRYPDNVVVTAVPLR